MSDISLNFRPDRFAVAPMIDVTTSAFRRFARILTKRSMLYTEMIAAEALIHGKLNLIAYDKAELPCVLQLGGSDPQKLALAAKIGEDFGYSAINLNAGCPSDKVQSGSFGAVLMKTPEVIAEACEKMQSQVKIPVTVKTRIGVDENDSFEDTLKIVKTIYASGCRHIILHARKAWLNGLSPKENRSVPPLNYERVYAMKELFPDLYITINGGLLTIDDCLKQLQKVDAVMLGRAIIDNPYLLAYVDSQIFNDKSEVKSRERVLYETAELCEQFVSEGHKLHHMTMHVLNLFNGCHGARRYRQYLSLNMHKSKANPNLLLEAYKVMKDA